MSVKQEALSIGGVVVKASNAKSKAMQKLGFNFIKYGITERYQYFLMEIAHVKLYVRVVYDIENAPGNFGELYSICICNEHDTTPCDDYVYRSLYQGVTDLKSIIKSLKSVATTLKSK